jgi:transposase InsO family protein
MKFNPQPMAKMAAAGMVVRPNEVWSIDVVRLDLGNRPFVVMVIDVHTRRLLAAVLTSATDEVVAATLERLARRSKRPDEIWIDDSFRLIETWAGQHGISVSYYRPTPQMRAISERVLRDLGSYLGDKSFASPMELGHAIERWRQSYVAARPLPKNADQ